MPDADSALPSTTTLIDFVRTEGRGVLATTSASGAPEAALVGVAVGDDGELVIDAAGTSRKVANLMHESRVAVVVGYDATSLQIEGTATLVTGDERRRCEDLYASQRPAERVRDPAYAVISVRPSWVRYYDTETVPPTVAEGDWPAAV